MIDTSEKNLEEVIEASLLAVSVAPTRGRVRDVAHSEDEYPSGGYYKRTSADYDKEFCLIRKDVLDFIYGTQPKEWKRFREQFSSEDEARNRFFDRLAKELSNPRRGTLDVLRNGIKANGCHFALAYFRPATSINAETQKQYRANIFAVVRQLRYSSKNQNSLDLTLFLNGLPIFTSELKNDLMGQTAAKNAQAQYRQDRDPKEPLFALGRCLAHFAVDPREVYVTTHLQGEKTVFRPFNQGRDTGAGNPVSYKGFATAYLWERIWAPASVLNLLHDFIQIIEEEDDKGRKTGTRSLLFPRYHQLDCVRRLLADARRQGTGQRYLIQHSAGSGKSNSIAWLAHLLTTLFDANDQPVFNSVIVITDRRILDKQLQRTVRQFEQTDGVVENIDTTSKKLKQALAEGKKIIVTTLQKFPVIAKDMGELAGKRFAVIIDEAHSSQSGSSTEGLKKVLAVKDLEEAERAEEEEEQHTEDIEDLIVKEVKARGHLPNVSYFAFTATPKDKTLQLFGMRRSDGGYGAFSLYSMRQAIEEHYILDVLQNYVTYTSYWKLLKTVEQDPRYERAKASRLLRIYVELHEHTIETKVAMMVEHFVETSAHRIGGKAKAMIVTRSRLHAVRYKHAIDRYLKAHGYPYKALVAFSGTVKETDGTLYTESEMNGFSENKTAETFKHDEYRFLIVANKFQTGFDQPLLHTMYVDKKLGGVNAVQTLSRLNRVYPNKSETVVLDFANSADKIEKAFTPYYERTFLTEGVDPNLLYDIQTRLSAYELYTEAEMHAVGDLWYTPGETQDKIHAALEPIVDQYKTVTAEEQTNFRKELTDYIRLYSFLVQVIAFVDTDLERLYVFSKQLIRKLPTPDGQFPTEVLQFIDIDSYRLQETAHGAITLQPQAGAIEPMRTKRTAIPLPDEQEPLSTIIEKLNGIAGGIFNEDDKVCLQELEGRLSTSGALNASVQVNTADGVRLVFDEELNRFVQAMMESNLKFYKHITDDDRFARLFADLLFERYLQTNKDVPQRKTS